ncbi:uncharacterized protein LOC106063569 [Biomphalaria glabrata]|uniref:Uncharacterized protein LOC106063569 n=1 Tax=Biomphalaria glabrata TaxID=6526 RepID=A0A2C9JQB0_BIOGL|nr:uncharacterized protein LOC106063569 [Biomphalaria glabrata]KAI8787003.1 chaperone protein dnaJ 72 [Biomphalaria glabrata]
MHFFLTTKSIISLSLCTRKLIDKLSICVRQKSHYETLGVTRTATKSEIRQAFLKLSKQCHPDRSSGKGDKSNREHHKKFVQINEAYSVLSKPLTRRDYDSTLDAERYVASRMKSSAYRTHSYGNNSDPGHTYYRNIYNETYWNDYSDGKKETFGPMTEIFWVTFTVTTVIIIGILYYMNTFISDPKLKKLRTNLTQEEVDKYDLIMTSTHEGSTVYYYAIPKKNDPSNFEILTLKRDKVEGSELNRLSELTDVYGEREET